MLTESFLAGIWASIGSTLGKLTAGESVGDSYLLWGGLLLAMVMANTWGCRYYLHSLDASSNSVAPTVISAASSYVLSGVIGIYLFKETASMQWWMGALLILLGLYLVARPRHQEKTKR